MFIKVEPVDFFMYSVTLIYDPENPDSEDQQVKDYLAENKLEPKYQGSREYEGRQSEIMFFGGCYLGKHLQRIGDIQRYAVEGEILTDEVERQLSASGHDPLADLKEGRTAAVARLVEGFHQESSFQKKEDGQLSVSLDATQVLAAAQRVAVEARQT